MQETPLLPQEVFPTDLRYLDCRCNIALTADMAMHVLLINIDKLKDYELHPSESLPIFNWLVRRMLKELDIVVGDFELDSSLEEFYQDFYAGVETDSFLAIVRNLLEEAKYRPTIVQAFCDGKDIVMSFGATNVDNVLRAEKRTNASAPK